MIGAYVDSERLSRLGIRAAWHNLSKIISGYSIYWLTKMFWWGCAADLKISILHMIWGNFLLVKVSLICMHCTDCTLEIKETLATLSGYTIRGKGVGERGRKGGKTVIFFFFFFFFFLFIFFFFFCFLSTNLLSFSCRPLLRRDLVCRKANKIVTKVVSLVKSGQTSSRCIKSLLFKICYILEWDHRLGIWLTGRKPFLHFSFTACSEKVH